jgi:hypothetical protein
LLQPSILGACGLEIVSALGVRRIDLRPGRRHEYAAVIAVLGSKGLEHRFSCERFQP